jgi:hypothetical protein
VKSKKGEIIMPIQSYDDEGKLVFESTESNVSQERRAFIEQLSQTVHRLERLSGKRIVLLSMKRGKISKDKPIFTQWEFEFEHQPKPLSEQKLVGICEFPTLGVEVKITGLLADMKKFVAEKEFVTQVIWAMLPEEIEFAEKEAQDEQSK